MNTNGTDKRDMAVYNMADAAHYLGLPYSTVKSWVVGQRYRTPDGEEKFLKPIIKPVDKAKRLLSFRNLVELHVLSLTRREFRIPMQKVRTALDYLKRELDTQHPLSDVPLETDGIDVFVERFEHLVSASRKGQLAMREVVKQYLQRIDRDKNGSPLRLYPFTRGSTQVEQPRTVVVDPEISFGRPVLAGTGIRTSILAERYKAGDTIQDLVYDYGLNATAIEEAIRVELHLAA